MHYHITFLNWQDTVETEIVRTLRKNVYFARKCMKVANPGWNRLSFLISCILETINEKKCEAKRGEEENEKYDFSFSERVEMKCWFSHIRCSFWCLFWISTCFFVEIFLSREIEGSSSLKFVYSLDRFSELCGGTLT